jgi:hypothetical protein
MLAGLDKSNCRSENHIVFLLIPFAFSKAYNLDGLSVDALPLAGMMVRPLLSNSYKSIDRRDFYAPAWFSRVRIPAISWCSHILLRNEARGSGESCSSTGDASD